MTTSFLIPQWVKRLRSGAHTQGEKYLRFRTDNQIYHSALGVYCNLLVEATDAIWKHVNYDLDTVFRLIAYDQEFTFFPSHEVLEFGGLEFSQALYISQLNDHGWTFEQIADEIENGFKNINKSSGIFIPEPPIHLLAS